MIKTSVCAPQCWGGQDRCLHHPQHRAGEDEVRRSGRPLPDSEDTSHSAACHGADRGKYNCLYSVSHRDRMVFQSQWCIFYFLMLSKVSFFDFLTICL